MVTSGYLIRFVLLPLVVSLTLSTVLTYLVRKLTHRFGLLDRPGQHKQHERPTPTLGGLPVFLAFVAGCLLSGPLTPRLAAIIQASFVLVCVGVWDDVRGVMAKLKLTTLFLATAWLWRHGVYLDAFGLSAPLALILTFLWVGLVASAFNGVDNHDGAAGGLALISSVATFCISWATWQRELAIISLVLGAACVGFLIFNFPAPRASIFLGDSGSLFLGFGLASLTVLGQWSSVGWKSAIVAVLLVFVPLLDFLFILITRGLDGRYKNWEDPIKMCGRDHLSHRLRYLGLAPQQVLLCFYGLAGWSSYAAYCVAMRPELLSLSSALSAILGVGLLGAGLWRVALPKDAFAEH